MVLSRLLRLDVTTGDMYMTELLETNHKASKYGVTLTPEEIKDMLTVRSQVLRNYGRVELGIQVSTELAEVFCTSPYIDEKNYAMNLNELHEIFYYLKNETEDRIGDFELIAIMKDCFDNDCAGSLELLKSSLEGFAERFRSDTQFRESLLERGEF